ncbi:MAG: nucleotidyltransferase substrate binding protein [Defluviitaleaceae bacterium]|nr:nucleotidyltransferase substrate binding protein [Defluviitaleaceae bacterium]
MDIRWLQRFQNFKRAFELLSEPLENNEIEQLSDLEQEGLIQRFEYTYELAWKVFKDYLEYSGTNITESTPRKIIKECAALGIFDEANINGDTYLNMMLTRNELSHVYNSEIFLDSLKKIKNSYIYELEKQYQFFIEKERQPND